MRKQNMFKASAISGHMLILSIQTPYTHSSAALKCPISSLSVLFSLFRLFISAATTQTTSQIRALYDTVGKEGRIETILKRLIKIVFKGGERQISERQ